MKINATIIRGAIWSAGTHITSIVIRFGSNVLLSRLLNPETFGILMIVGTIRHGIELSSDIGLSQNVVQNKSGSAPSFLNTVWVVQIIRSILQSVLVFVCAAWIADLYGVPAEVFEISSVGIFIGAFTSTSIYLLHRNMQFAKFNLFELAMDACGAIIAICAALVSPTAVSLLVAAVVTQVLRTVASYFLGPERSSFQFQKKFALEILYFGRWIFLSSMFFFFSTSFDRLYIGAVAPLALVGIYGMSRVLADLPATLVARIGYSVIFPLISASQQEVRSELRSRVSAVRIVFLLSVALLIAFGVSFADIAVRIIYDDRYRDAAWMLPILLFGAWSAILCSANEYALTGLGKPSYNTIGSAIKLVYCVCALPLAYQNFGMGGIVVASALSEIARYFALVWGARREKFSFIAQDSIATFVFIALIGAISWTRAMAGLGTVLDSILLPAIWLPIGAG